MWNKPGKPLPPRVYREISVDIGFRIRKEVGRDLPCVLVLALRGATGSRTPGYGRRQSCGIFFIEHNLCKQIRRFSKGDQNTPGIASVFKSSSTIVISRSRFFIRDVLLRVDDSRITVSEYPSQTRWSRQARVGQVLTGKIEPVTNADEVNKT